MSSFRMLCIAMMIAVVPTVSALAASPYRNENIWNGMAHQPTAAAVGAQERAAGLQASQQERLRQDEIVEGLARQLLNGR
jgi:hypothetical protein